MVKTPKMRHSKNHREPVTIDLEADAVSRVENDKAAGTSNEEAVAEQAANASQPQAPEDAAEQSIRAADADFEPWEHDEAAAAAAVDPQREHPDAASDVAPAEDALPERPNEFDADDPLPRQPSQDYSSRNDEQDSGATEAAAVPPEPVGPGRGGMNNIAAGLIGAVIALVGAGGLQFAGILGTPGVGSASLDGVNSDVAALKTEMARLTNSEHGGEAAARVKGLSDQLDQVKATVASLQTTVQSGAGGDSAELTALRDKLAAMETSVAALGQADKAAPVDLGPVNEKLTALDALTKSAGEAATKQEGQLAALEQTVSQLSTKVEAQAQQPRIALAIAASALKAALDRGAPFSAELETFAAIAPDAPEIAALRAHAEKGVPTRIEIASGTDAAASAMIAAATPRDENAGFLQNLLSSAASLVKVRPVGAVQGAGVPETVARFEVAVNQGDYAKALSEYDTLPEAAKAAGADFAAKLKARLDVEAQINALIASAMKA